MHEPRTRVSRDNRPGGWSSCPTKSFPSPLPPVLLSYWFQFGGNVYSASSGCVDIHIQYLAARLF